MRFLPKRRPLTIGQQIQSGVFGNRVNSHRKKVTENDLSLSDVTTWNSTTGRHGFLKKLDNDSTHYMDGTGNWTQPVTGGTIIGASLGIILCIPLGVGIA